MPTLEEINQRLKDHDTRFGSLEGRMQRVERRLEDNTDTLTIVVQMLNQRFGDIDGRFEQIDRRFDYVDRRFEQIDRRFEQIDRRFEQVDQRFEQVDQRFDDLKCFMELKFEEQRSDFRAFREMQKHQAGQIEDLQKRVGVLEVKVG